MKNIRYTLLIIQLIVVFLITAFIVPNRKSPESDENTTIKAGNDFATDVLRNAWDMNEFSDVDKWLNKNGEENDFINLTVNNGVFTATTKGTYSEFYPLFPGYEPGLEHGKIGALYPIESRKYQCLYLALKVDQRAVVQVVYTKDKSFIKGLLPTNSGRSQGHVIYPTADFQLYKANLATHSSVYDLLWTALPEWQTLRINPTWNPNSTISYDWVRLTDCNPVYFNINGLAKNTNYDFWVGLGSPERLVLIQKNTSSDGDGVLKIDTQGMEETSYTFYIRNAGTTNAVKSGKLTINSKPEVEFIHPSPTSGEDFATAAGAPWDMSGPEDVWDTRCSTYQFIDGSLHVYTNPHQCPGGDGEADPIIFLSFPNGQLAAPAEYRYLNIRLYQNGPFSAPDEGMIGRWMWRSNGCMYVSREISYQVGWHTYSIDLYDPYNGKPIGSDYCSANTHWLNFTEPNANFRFDPNENVMDFQFHQQIDWIKLNKMDNAKSGDVYTIEYKSSEEDLQSLVFYYTDDLDQPKKHLAKEYIPQTGSGTPVGPYTLFLPTILKNARTYKFSTYKWDTSGVAPAEYYICSVANDGYNEAIDCSDAVLKITP